MCALVCTCVIVSCRLRPLPPNTVRLTELLSCPEALVAHTLYEVTRCGLANSHALSL